MSVIDAGDGWHRNRAGDIDPDSLHNMKRALAEQNIQLRYDECRDDILVRIGDAPETRLDDPLFIRVWLATEEKFEFSPKKGKFHKIVEYLARQDPCYIPHKYGRPRGMTYAVKVSG